MSTPFYNDHIQPETRHEELYGLSIYDLVSLSLKQAMKLAEESNDKGRRSSNRGIDTDNCSGD